ncbi:hypothetical protein [Emticicia sp. SJ17W-69]|uniref:hypothetical protein n=1 Tax=Emticicia sp. SJ17W-69 TaxID=3421657 RepID=UPI003EBD231E
MKNKLIRQDELEQLGNRINGFITDKSKFLAQKLNRFYQSNRQQTIYILVLFGLFVLVINILSFYIF